jgi:hypothetical protein
MSGLGFAAADPIKEPTDTAVLLQGMPQAAFPCDAIAVSTAKALFFQHAYRLEIGQNPLHSPFGNSNHRSQIPHAQIRSRMKRDQHVRVVRQVSEARLGLTPAFFRIFFHKGLDGYIRQKIHDKYVMQFMS